MSNTPPDNPVQGSAPEPEMPSSDSIYDALKSSHSIAVVGLSSRKFRPSYGVAQYMQSVGYRIIPVNPEESEILGEKCYATLEQIPEKVDIVDIFRRSEFVPEVVDSAAADRFSSTALNLLGAREKSIMGRYKLSFAMTPLDLMQTPTGAYLSPQRSN